MNVKKFLILSFAIIPASFLAGCGTFEIGIEPQVVIEPDPNAEETPLETAAPLPTVETPLATPSPAPTELPTVEPLNNDEAAILATLAERFGTSPGELPVTITQMTENHALGSIENGYFLAAKQNGQWLIVYDGQATPPCREVDFYQFPPGMVPECLGADNQLIVRSGSVDSMTSSLLSLDCGPGSPGANPGTAMYVACNVQDGLRSRNTSALLGYMVDPFIIGYWLSEGVMGSPEEMMDTIHYLYNFHDENYVPRLTFTTDRALFPELDGRPLEGRFGPEVNVVEVIFSQGWGEGDQEALIFISQDSAGNFKWHGLLTGDLDVSIPGS